MRNAFKNYRKKSAKKQNALLPTSTQSSDTEPSVSTGLSVTEPPPKRLRLYSENEQTIDEEEYEETVRKLQEEFKNKNGKKGSSHSIIKNLMEKTKFQRHKWIRQDKPMILEVLDKFPYLSTSRWVSLHKNLKIFSIH